MFTLLATLALSPAHAQAWTPYDFELPDTLNGSEITRTEVDGWIQRTVALQGHGIGGGVHDIRGGMALEEAGGPAPSRPERRRSMAKGAAEPPPSPAQTQGPLKAGTTDDNEAFGEYLEFLATWKGKPGIAGQHVEMDVRDRAHIQVKSAVGTPLPGAKVTVSSGRKTVWSGTTYGDGRAPFFPHLDSVNGGRGDLTVSVEHDGARTQTAWDGASPLSLIVDDAADDRVQLDVVFVIDTTGSMSDEIDRIKSTLLTVTDQVKNSDRPVDLRYGAVLYRDIGDEYLTRHTPLTTDLEGFDAKLQQIEANGGGDGPESYNQGLAVAVDQMDWRSDAAKLVFLVADAQPHMDYEGDVDYAQVSQAALARGIRIHTVAASGLQDFGSLVFRQTAQLTQGRFIFIEYGSAAASAADHGVTGPVHSNNLDAILLRQIRREIEGWGRTTLAMR
jgi:hypothetical protein